VNMARVVTYLGLFYRTGVDLLQSLLLVEQMATNRVVASIVRTAREQITGGSTIANAFSHSPLVPTVVMRSLALGESTGRLDESLARAQAYYAREIPAAVRRVITLIQPALIVLLGAVVLIVALAIMLPILNIYNTLGVRR
jgi:type IV pilus assembly protein PilC